MGTRSREQGSQGLDPNMLGGRRAGGKAFPVLIADLSPDDTGLALGYHRVYHVLATQLWAGYLNSLSLIFLMCKIVAYLTHRVILRNK